VRVGDERNLLVTGIGIDARDFFRHRGDGLRRSVDLADERDDGAVLRIGVEQTGVPAAGFDGVAALERHITQ